MQVIGEFQRFWGSTEWDIKVDFEYEQAKTITFTKITVEFKNSKNGLTNSFEVLDLQSCVTLMKKFAEGFGISVFDRRIANWLAEYFNSKSLDVDANEILKYFKNDSEEKIDVKVKKLTFINKIFTDILEYNEEDLQIDFKPFYEDEKWVIGDKSDYNYPILSSIKNGSKKKKVIEYTSKDIINKYNGMVEVTNVISNSNSDSINDIKIEDLIENEFRPVNVKASLIAPDKTILGVFQPLEISKSDLGLKVVWKIDELKLNHQIKIEYELRQRMPFILKLQTEEGSIESYINYFETNSDELNRFSVKIPSLAERNIFSRNYVVSISAIFPIEFTTQELLYLYPHYVVKITDQGNCQKILFSELFVDAIFFDQIRIGGSDLPVITVYESLIPKLGSKLTKKIIRHHSFSEPIINYELESSSNETIEINEEYPQSTQINLFSLGSESITEKIIEQNTKTKILQFFLNATSNMVNFTLIGPIAKDIEKALQSVKILNKDIDIELSQNINIETIVDKSNKYFIEFMQSNFKKQFTGNKIRLRSFNLKILEKLPVLETTASSNELDLAFEALKNNQNLEALKAKIASSYAQQFSTTTTSEPVSKIESEIKITEENSMNEEVSSDDKNYDITENFPSETIQSIQGNQFGEKNQSAKEMNQNEVSKEDIETEISDEEVAESLIEMEKSYNATSQDVEASEMTPEEMSELNEFIHDYDEKPNENIGQTQKTSSEVEGEDFLNSIPPEETEPTIESNKKIESDIVETQIIKKEKKAKKQEKVKTKSKIEQKETIVQSSIEFFVLNENPDEVKQDLGTNVAVLGKNQKTLDLNNITEQPEGIFFKIPKKERYLILVVNPREDLSSYVYGRWKKETNPKYKVLLSTVKGMWHIRLQLLESGKMYDLVFEKK